jgi:predicted dehydrogenase
VTKARLGVGIVGCGSISLQYLHNAPLFGGVEMRACADINHAAAVRRAADFHLKAMAVDDLIGSPDIDIVLNLTVPAAHFEVSMRAIEAGKHVFTEKPLAATAVEGSRLMASAAEHGLAVGSAPDTFLGPAGRLARRLLDADTIGRPIIGTAFMLGHGMEHWHPDPAFYFQPGGGPVMDMGPYYLTMLVNLVGPVRRVQAVATSGQSERLVTAEGPRKGTTIKVGTPTSLLSLIEFSSGLQLTFGASWDVYRHSNQPIELHGTKGSLRLPDPDNFGGVVSVSDRGAAWHDTDTADHLFGAPNWPADVPDRANYRMAGLADFAASLVEGRRPRASGAVALHVLEVMEAILNAARTGVAEEIAGEVDRAAPLSEEQARQLLA